VAKLHSIHSSGLEDRQGSIQSLVNVWLIDNCSPETKNELMKLAGEVNE